MGITYPAQPSPRRRGDTPRQRQPPPLHLALGAAFDLRSFSATKKPLVLERDTAQQSPSGVHLDTVKAQEMRRASAERKEMLRQREEDALGIEAAKRKAEEKALRLAKEREQADKARRAEEIRREIVRRHVEAEAARRRKEQEEAERKLREAEEEERRRREAAEAERLRRMPTACEACSGSGRCQTCGGDGYTSALYLVGQIAGHGVPDSSGPESASVEYGRKPLGCHDCGGYHHGILGEVKIGMGICLACDGHGKIWPKLEDEPKSFRRAHRTKVDGDYRTEPAEPLSPQRKSVHKNGLTVMGDDAGAG